jgi:hypothetical protein
MYTLVFEGIRFIWRFTLKQRCITNGHCLILMLQYERTLSHFDAAVWTCTQCQFLLSNEIRLLFVTRSVKCFVDCYVMTLMMKIVI